MSFEFNPVSISRRVSTMHTIGNVESKNCPSAFSPNATVFANVVYGIRIRSMKTQLFPFSGNC